MQSFSHLILVGMEKNETMMQLRYLSKSKVWNETENKYKINCPIKSCKNNKNKGFSNQSKLENHLICQHHVCPCCQNDGEWKSVHDLLYHLIEWHPSKKGPARNCFVCEVCNQYICLYADHFERHKNTCSQSKKLNFKKYKNHIQTKLSSPEMVIINTVDNNNRENETISVPPYDFFSEDNLPDLFCYD